MKYVEPVLLGSHLALMKTRTQQIKELFVKVFECFLPPTHNILQQSMPDMDCVFVLPKREHPAAKTIEVSISHSHKGQYDDLLFKVRHWSEIISIRTKVVGQDPGNFDGQASMLNSDQVFKYEHDDQSAPDVSSPIFECLSRAPFKNTEWKKDEFDSVGKYHYMVNGKRECSIWRTDRIWGTSFGNSYERMALAQTDCERLVSELLAARHIAAFLQYKSTF